MRTAQVLKTHRAFFPILVFLLTIPWANAKPKARKPQDRYKITLQVDGLSCSFCAYGLEKKLESLKGVEKLEIDLNKGLVHLWVRPNIQITDQTIRKKVKEAGFTLREISREQGRTTKGEKSAKSDF